MREYEAARRQATGEPILFGHTWTDDDGARHREEFTCSGQVQTILLSELAYNSDVDTATPEGLALIREFFSQAIGDPDEYRRFFRYALAHIDDDQLNDIMAGLVEDFLGRPTKRPSDSPGTPSATGAVSKVVSLQERTVRHVAPALVLEEAVRQIAEGS